MSQQSELAARALTQLLNQTCAFLVRSFALVRDDYLKSLHRTHTSHISNPRIGSFPRKEMLTYRGTDHPRSFDEPFFLKHVECCQSSCASHRVPGKRAS